MKWPRDRRFVMKRIVGVLGVSRPGDPGSAALSTLEGLAEAALAGSEGQEGLRRVYEGLLTAGWMASAKKSPEVARALGWIFRFSGPDLRWQLIEDLRPMVNCLARSKHSAPWLAIMLTYGSVMERQALLLPLLPTVPRLLCHRIAGPLLEEAYTADGADPGTRALLRQALYGVQLGTGGDELVDRLDEAFLRRPKAQVLEATKINLLKVIEKGVCVGSSLVHAVVLDFLEECGPSDEAEILSAAGPHAEAFLGSPEGRGVFLQLLEAGTAEGGKAGLVSLLAPSLPALAPSDPLFTLALFPATADPSLAADALLPPLFQSATAIASTEAGATVLAYLLTPDQVFTEGWPPPSTVREVVWRRRVAGYAYVVKSQLSRASARALLRTAAADPIRWAALGWPGARLAATATAVISQPPSDPSSTRSTSYIQA